MANDTCLCIDLRTAAQKLTQMYDEAMSASGMTVTQFSQLHLIMKLEGPTLKQLAEASGLDRSTLGRNVRVLEKAEFVTIKAGNDARTRTLHLTRKGNNAFKKAVPLWYDIQSQLNKRLGETGRTRFDDMISTLTAPVAAGHN